MRERRHRESPRAPRRAARCIAGAIDVAPARARRFATAAAALCTLLLASGPVLALDLGTVQIEGVEGELEDNVASRLSLMQHPEDEPLTEARLSYLLRQAPGEVLAALEPFGYYGAELEITPNRRGEVVDVRVAIEPGRPVRVRTQSVTLDGAGADDPPLAALRQAFRPQVGEVLDHRLYEASKSAIQRTLLARGYFDAEPGTQRVTVTRAEHAADVDVGWRTGPRYDFGPTRFVDSHIDEEVLRRYLPYAQGQPFAQEQLVELHQALASLGYFGLVDIQPQPQDGEGGEVPVEVGLTPAKRTLYSVGLSYGTDHGAELEFGMDRRYVNRAGHKLDVDLAFGQQRTLGSVVYRVPTLSGPLGWWSAGANLREEEIAGFGTVSSAELVAGRSGTWEGYTASVDAHVLRSRWDALPDQPVQSTLVFPQMTVAWSKGDHPLYPRRGFGWSATVRAGHSALGSDADFAQLLASAVWIHPLGERNRILVRGQAGTTLSDEFEVIPPQLRFYAGGDRSVRGYGYQEIGPGDAEGRVIGGEHLLTAGAEFEHMFNDTWGMAAFVDAGDAFSDGSRFDARPGVGLGVRWRSPVGPVRVDVGVGLDDPDRAVRLHLTIGPEL